MPGGPQDRLRRPDRDRWRPDRPGLRPDPRRRPADPSLDTAVILLAEDDDPAQAANAFEFGVFGYVVRPLPGQLLITAMNALRRRDLEIAHRRLSQSREERRQAIIDMVPIAIFAKDRSGHYVLANTKAEEMARMERGELLGKTDDAFLSPWHAESYTASDGRILAGAAVIEREDTIEYGKRSGSATGRRAEDQELFPPRGVVRVRARQEVELALDQDFEALRP